MNLTLRRLVVVWLWAVAAAALLIVVVAPAPQSVAPQVSVKDSQWSILRLPPKIDVTPAVNILAKGSLWGGQSAGSSEPDPKILQWRTAAIVGAGKDRAVLVQFGDDRILPVKVGDKLPDGTPVAQIREDGICVLLEGKKRFLPMPGQFTPLVW